MLPKVRRKVVVPLPVQTTVNVRVGRTNDPKPEKIPNVPEPALGREGVAHPSAGAAVVGSGGVELVDSSLAGL